jgi:hypothetical protein
VVWKRLGIGRTSSPARVRVSGSATVGAAAPTCSHFDAPLGRLCVAPEVGDVAVFRESDRPLVKLGQSLLAPSPTGGGRVAKHLSTSDSDRRL